MGRDEGGGGGGNCPCASAEGQCIDTISALTQSVLAE